MGDYARASRYLRESIRIRERAGHAGLATGYANLAEAFLRQGHHDEARTWVERALGEEPRMLPALRPDVWRLLAEIELHQGRADRAREAARTSRARAQAVGDAARMEAAETLLAQAEQQ
jgi:tetratricopeptide (TPR) repeat protein